MVVVQYNDGAPPIYDACIAQVKGKIVPPHVHHLILNTRLKSRCNDYRGVSNVVRFNEACFNPTMLWLDIDAMVIRWPDFPFERGKVYFAKDLFGNPDNWCFYVNGRTDFFQEMMSDYAKGDDPSLGWWKKLLLSPKYEKDIAFFPHGYFAHIQMSRFIGGKGYLQYGNNDYGVNRDPKTNELSLEIRIP
jgi:hypothetical protein